MKGGLFRPEHDQFDSIKKLEFRYCKESEISKKNKIFLMFKACFLHKIRGLE